MSLWTYTHPLLPGGNEVTAFDIFSSDPSWHINRDSFVLANICEYQTIPGDPRPRPWSGAASLQIKAIIPQDNGHLIVQAESDWNMGLPIRIQIFIFD